MSIRQLVARVLVIIFTLLVVAGLLSYVWVHSRANTSIDALDEMLYQYLSAYGKGDYATAYQFMLTPEEGGRATLEELSYWGAPVRYHIHKLKVTRIVPIFLWQPKLRVYLTIQYGSAEGECAESQAFLFQVDNKWKIYDVINISPGNEDFPLSSEGCDKLNKLSEK